MKINLHKKSTPKYISLNKIVLEAKKAGVDFGKGDPYNRLRYYTKIGIFPNMVRVKSAGHYPESALKKLIRIETLKGQGIENDRIKRILEGEQLTFLFDPETRTRLAKYAIGFIFGILFSVGSLYSLNTGIKSLGQNAKIDSAKTGSYLAPENSEKVFVFDKRVNQNSVVFVTFTTPYSPASGYFVSAIVPSVGFELSFSSNILKSAKFNYYIAD
ncbi:MerR family transcriptional regulator [Candidatus Parcubacteria bacterium]|nr:MerR family transcriptional regulator [Patescibacteria group bacterium]MCG2689304.1 MerR family transcriptional regulator [Candidatus Parcubacteria bacterium]